MKHARIMVVAVLLIAFLLSGCAQAVPAAATEPLRSNTSAVVSAAPAAMPQTVFPDSGYSLVPLAAHRETSSPAAVQKEAESLFRAKFEGNDVAGSGETVDGVYRLTATETDGEAWHVKLESNYPTVAGRDYRVTYSFVSDVAGKVKFGDFQEFEIQKGENSVTGMMIASGGTSYLDLQLGMLPPFTIDFTSVEIEEFADEVDYEDALSVPVNFEKESIVWEKHDQGYAPVLTRGKDGLSINYLATSWDSGVWKSRLYVRTGLIPEAGVRYHVTADVACDQDMPFEVLFNNDEEEKGYGALYGQSVAAGEVTACEAVIIGGGDGDELVLQFSLGMAPEESTVTIGNLRVEKIIDHYKTMLPAGFALDRTVATGKTLYGAVPVSAKAIPLTRFSYSGTDTVYEGHDDGYAVSLEESASSATLKITQAPEADRGVWKVRLYAATGVTLEAGITYRIKYSLASTGNQAKYEACFDGDYENAYGALYDRSLTAGGTDQVELIVTPDVSHGSLTLRLQMGETDSAAGNTVTLSNLSVEKLAPQYQSAGTVTLSTGGTGNVCEEHSDGVEQTLTASGGSAALNVSAARTDGGVWSSKLLVRTGVTPEAGARYRVSATVAATGETGEFEILYQNTGAEELYGGRWGLNGAGDYSGDFTAPAEGCGELVLAFQLGNTAANNTVTVCNIQVRRIIDGAPAAITLPGFAYPTVTADSTVNNSFDLEANSGAQATLSGDGSSATATVTKPGDDWHVKLYAKPGLELEKDQTYTISMDVTGASGCTACYKNTATGAEDGFGTEAIADGTVTHTVTPTESGTLEIVLKIGSVSANTSVKVSNVKITKTTTAYIPITLSGFAYPTATPASTADNSFFLEANSGAEATLTGNGSSATATVTKPGDDWHVKLYAKPNYELQAGKAYQISLNVTGASGCTVCYKNTATGAEDGFGTELIGSGTVTHTVTPAENGTLEILLKIGNVPADTAVTVSGIQISEEADKADEVTPGTVDYWLEPPGEGAAATQDGNSVTIVTPAPNDDWKIKFYVLPRLELEAGKKYQVSFDVTNASGCEVCYKNTASGDEKGFGSEAAGSGTVTHTITAADTAVMEILLKLGKLPADTVVTVSNVHIYTLTPGFAPVTLSGFAYPITVPASTAKNSFDLEANSGAEATLSGDGSSATATVTKPGDDWHVKLYAKPGVTLEAGKSYTISLNVTGASGCTVCYKNTATGAEDGFGTELIGSGTVTHTVTPAENGTLEILLKIGNVPADTAVTVSNIQISEYTTGDLDVTPEGFAYPVTTPGGVTKNSFDLEANSGAGATLSGDGNSATAKITKSGDDWHIKLYAKPGVELEAGKTYTIGMSVTGADGCQVCYKNTATGAEDGFGTETAGSGTVTHTVTPTEGGTMEILLKIGTLPAGTTVTVSGITITTPGEGTTGENLATATLTAGTRGNVNFWAHEDYAATLSGDGSSASLAIGTTPAEGREAWKVKLFVETGIALEAGKHYRISADVSASAETDYEICYNDGAAEKGVGALYGLHAASASQMAVFEGTPETNADLILQFNLGWAAAPCTVTVSNVKVEEMTEDAGESVLPSFSYDSVGSFASAADNGYVVSLDKGGSSDVFKILQAPAERNPWNVKLNVRTGFTPEKGKGYRVSFDLDAARPQGTFELFFDGSSEGAYGQFYGLALTAGKNRISQIIYPRDSKGELVLQLRFGKTDGADGNTYTVSSVKIEELTFRYTQTPEMKEVATLDKQPGYVEQLEKTRDRATVRIEKTPAEGKEPWKSKLFVETGVTLREGQKYRVSMVVKSIIPAPFEICLNDGGVEKGLGAIFGLISTPSGRYVEYVTYARQDTQLVIQLSLGNCSAPNSIMLESVKVEQAGTIDPISDTIYTFS